MLVWTLAWLALFDIGINAAVNTKRLSQTQIGRYFEHGRSVEGKLSRDLAADPQRGGPIWHAGWFDPESMQGLPAAPAAGHDLLVALYGQSFARFATEAAAEQDGRITVRMQVGPAAPPSHSYAAYLAEAPLRKADVVVFGILSSSVADMGSMSGLIWHFENPAPYTFPRYRLDAAGRLVAEQPLIRSEAQFLQAFRERSQAWDAFKAQLAHSDRGYDRFIFEQNLADHSTIVRLLRRGWVSHRGAYELGVYDPAKGFDPQSREVQVLRAMLVDLKRRTAQRGEHLIVLLLHTRGQADHLHAVLGDTLAREQIDTISTHTLFSANDPSNFLPDGHYVPPANEKLAQALRKRIRERVVR